MSVKRQVHNNWKVKDRQINVGVDVWDYKPVSEDAIADLIQSEEGKSFSKAFNT